MSEHATDPNMDLVAHPQDERQPRIRLGTFLALLRVLAGRRGHAGVVWHRFGFTYAVTVTREHGSPAIDFDVDEAAEGGTTALDRIRNALD